MASCSTAIMAESLVLTSRRVPGHRSAGAGPDQALPGRLDRSQNLIGDGTSSMRLRRIAIAFLASVATTIGMTAADASSPQLTNLVGQGPVAFTPNISAGTTVGQSACNSN